MKIDRLETHDRYQHFIEDQSRGISQGCEDCLKKNPLSLKLQEYSPYVYLFAHPRTSDDGHSQRMIWQPRLCKPKAQTNSYLFRAQSKTDLIEICWLLPPREQWNQYKKGNITESDITNWSINLFKTKRAELEESHPEDLSDERIRYIYRLIKMEMEQFKPVTLAASQAS